jgi:hypothetical protein
VGNGRPQPAAVLAGRAAATAGIASPAAAAKNRASRAGSGLGVASDTTSIAAAEAASTTATGIRPLPPTV